MRKVVVWGGYGGGNYGDELTLAIALRDFTRKEATDLMVLSATPMLTRWLHPGVKVMPYELPVNLVVRTLGRLSHSVAWLAEPLQSTLLSSAYWNMLRQRPDWVEAVTGADELYLVSGGYMNDLFDFNSIILPVMLASEQGVKINMSPLGIGPFQSAVNQKLFKRLFRDVLLTVRDVQSLAFCQQLGLSAQLAPDDGVRTAELAPDLNERIAPGGFLNEPKIGLGIYYQRGSSLTKAAAMDWWEEVLRCLIAAGLGRYLEGFCFHTTHLLDFADLVALFSAVGLNLDQVKSPPFHYLDGINNLRAYRLTVTTRFHAAVVSSVFDLPVFAVSSGDYYTQKMNSPAVNPTAHRVVIDQVSPEAFAEAILTEWNRLALEQHG